MPEALKFRIKSNIGREKMEILVCVKRVPDTSENEIELNSAGNDIDRDDLVYSVNEWDSGQGGRQCHGGVRWR
jgi:hypothetical protein